MSAVLVLAFRGHGSRAEVIPVETHKVTRRELVATVTASGIVRSAARDEIRSELSGRVVRVNVKEGEVVLPGQVILELDQAGLALEYARVMAELASAEADLARLGDMSAGPGQDLEVIQAQARLDLARARFEEARQGPAGVEVDRAENALGQAEMAWKEAEREAGLMKELYVAGAIPRKTMDEAMVQLKTRRSQYEMAKKEYGAVAYGPRKTDVDAAFAQLRGAEAGLALAVAQARSRETAKRAAMERVSHLRANLEFLGKQMHATRIRTHTGGILASLKASSGEPVGAGMLVAEVIDPGRLFVEAGVDEVDIARIEIGQRAKISFDACPGREFYGTVAHIAPGAVPEPGISRFNIRVDMGATGTRATNGVLRPGMSADVEVITARRPRVLVVPAQAITIRNGRKVVLVAAGGRVKEVPVICGLETISDVEVAGGLEAGDEVIVGPYEALETLNDGDAVSIRREGAGSFIEFKIE